MNMLTHPFNIQRDHFSGYAGAEIEFIQYGDLHCSFCANVYTEIKLLQEIMGSRMKFIYRHFPLPHRNPLALEAAIAAESAALQQKFWYMHDIIFENQERLSRNALVEFAKEIELDMDRYEMCREDQKVFRKVTTDFESGVKSGIAATPAFYINGHRYNGKADFENFYKTCRYLIAVRQLHFPDQH